MNYRCIIVDDEEMILERLEQIFRLQSEFELVGKAYSGIEGVSLVAATKPDIVITDIVMPDMNGIDMIEQLRLTRPHMEFIILSAYSDFVYAKQAMRMNVHEYVEKVPLSEEELLASLRRARERLNLQRSRHNEFQKLVQHRLENVYRIRRQLIGELIRGDLMPKRFSGLTESMNVDNKLIDSYCCIVMEWVDVSLFLHNYTTHDQGTIRYGMINIAEETIREQACGFACEWSDERLIAIVSWAAMNSTAELMSKSIQLGHLLISNIRTYMKQNIHVAISERYSGWHSLPIAFHEASSLCLYGYYVTVSQVYTRRTVTPVKDNAEERLAKGLDRLYTALLEEPPYLEILKIAEPLKEAAIQERLTRNRMMKLIGEFMEKIRREAESRNKDLRTWPELGSGSGMTFKSHWHTLLEAMRMYLDKHPESRKQEIVKAKQFIEMHLSERLSLDDVAHAVNLAPTYFSALFKRENGQSFVDYVNRRKIEKAAALLKEREYSNTHLCMLVGIQSEKYLCTLFKEMYGMPPQKFRKSMR
ncbi:response regulator transcription factor [Paenibacillus sedimenti]|uniref:Response regulator n=1 Tax=Paenibacillus sedimenti TaxID=2770274 RepID=A0A926QHQ0_9BACL|nr:response regulator [Paenibacillus sedimenti]MBD0379735.1 response regulator [Paenibacillus sedimenti]